MRSRRTMIAEPRGLDGYPHRLKRRPVADLVSGSSPCAVRAPDAAVCPAQSICRREVRAAGIVQESSRAGPPPRREAPSSSKHSRLREESGVSDEGWRVTNRKKLKFAP
jgi:hypothetical protein